ncbi:MAG: hypothetical protein ACKPKO_60700, partial [Candidatus Fonsibacter sp.]
MYNNLYCDDGPGSGNNDIGNDDSNLIMITSLIMTNLPIHHHINAWLLPQTLKFSKCSHTHVS